MLLFIVKRLASGIVTLWAVITISFFLVRSIPGDPFATEKGVSERVRKAQEEKFGYDKPMLKQYLTFISDIARGDFYPSIKYRNWTVLDIIAQSFPISALLGFLALTIAVVVGMIVGTFAAARRGSATDRLTMGIVVVGICLPNFIVAPILVLIFSLWLGIFPPAGLEQGAWSLVLPAVALALPYIAYISRLTRASVIEALQSDYIRTARAKGLPESRVLFGHGLRNSLIPVVTFLGPAAAGVMTGSFVIEQVFHIPGLGKHFVNAVLNKDAYLVLGAIAVYSALLILFNIIVDVSYRFIDPRIGEER